MELINNDYYLKDIQTVSNCKYNWEVFKDKNILITGATGMIGSFLVDVLMNKNINELLNCTVIAVGRNLKKAELRFESYFTHKNFIFYERDINDKILLSEIDQIHFILHAASNTHPKAYSNDPIGTISTNVIATKNLLDLAVEKNCERFVFLSSVEVYGENRRDVDKFKEDYCGYIDCNTLRAGYPESKRVGESLCQAYISQKGLDVVIPRLSRVFGPSMLLNDSKALSQFILKAVKNEDIVLKSEGTQFYSYMYVGDAVSSIIKIIIDGTSGNAYNVTNPEFDITLRDLATLVAKTVEKKVVFEIPEMNEAKGYSKATKAILDIDKIEQEVQWHPIFSLEYCINNTITIIKSLI